MKISDISGLEFIKDYYSINMDGSIYSLSRKSKGVPIKINPSKDKDGYLMVSLYTKEGKYYKISVHRLCAKAFIPNDDIVNKTVVNHIDENKENNNHENLEWCTVSYNNSYGSRLETVSVSNPLRKIVANIDADGNIIKIYNSIASVKEDGFDNSKVSNVINGKRKTHGGYKWIEIKKQ